MEVSREGPRTQARQQRRDGELHLPGVDRLRPGDREAALKTGVAPTQRSANALIHQLLSEADEDRQPSGQPVTNRKFKQLVEEWLRVLAHHAEPNDPGSSRSATTSPPAWW